MSSLSLKGAGSSTTVELDGKQIFPTAVRIHARPSGTTAVIEVPILDCEFEGEVVAKIPDTTRETLIALGWKPPAEATYLKCADDGCHWMDTPA